MVNQKQKISCYIDIQGTAGGSSPKTNFMTLRRVHRLQSYRCLDFCELVPAELFQGKRKFRQHHGSNRPPNYTKDLTDKLLVELTTPSLKNPLKIIDNMKQTHWKTPRTSFHAFHGVFTYIWWFFTYISRYFHGTTGAWFVQMTTLCIWGHRVKP